MKTKTFSILFALVMILSLSVGVFAQDFEQTWDENTVLQVFSDMNLLWPDMFEDEDSDYIWVENDEPVVKDFVKKDVTLEDLEYEAKAPIGTAKITKATFDPCGDGLILFEMTITRADDETATVSQYYGPEKTTYLRSISAKVDGVSASVTKVTCSGSDDGCGSIRFRRNNATGQYEAKIKGYIQYNGILTASSAPMIEISVVHTTYRTAFGWAEDEAPVTAADTAAPELKRNYCQAFLQEYDPKGGNVNAMDSVRAVYDENTGEARFQVTIRNYKSTAKDNYIIPADVMIDGFGSRYTSYTCKYTIYNNANGAPRTDYCKYGEGIGLGKNALIRFDITIDHLSSAILRTLGGADLPFTFRIGGMDRKVTGVFKPVEFPCPVVSRMQVKDPLYRFLTPYFGENDKTISASGAYGIYKDGVWGMYQKCGKYAYMMVRLANDGVKDETINLKNVAVAINGGTPMSWNWVLSTQDAFKNKITLPAGEEVILIGRAKITDYPYQTNSDLAMTGAINFLDYGFYITGSVYSDHNNTNCVAAPK